jgi:hypothetical protein
MVSSEAAREAVLDYLRDEFAGAVMTHETPTSTLVVDIRHGDHEWTVEFDRDFLETAPSEIARRLRDFNLGGELRRGEGLRFIVSNAGVRLSSSN